MKPSDFLHDILSQPAELARVLDHFLGAAGARDLAAAAAEVRRARRIVVSSMGSAILSAAPLARALDRFHDNVHLVETHELMRENRWPESLFILVSRSGESAEVAAFAPRARAAGARVLAITMTPESTLAKNADLVLHDPASFDAFICTKAFTSLALCGLLLSATAEKGGPDEAERAALKRQFAWMEAEKNACFDRVAGWEALRPDAGLTFLSHGPGIALAAAGALWTEEASRAPCAWTSIGHFHHGPVERVDDSFSGVWIDLTADERSRHLWRETTRRGGRFITLAPGEAHATVPLPREDVAPDWLIFPAALVIQLVAERMATVRGLRAGDMRYLGWVVA